MMNDLTEVRNSEWRDTRESPRAHLTSPTNVPPGVPLLVEDVAFQSVSEGGYDLAIFPCGYEQRSTHLASLLPDRVAAKHLVLAFAGDKDAFARKRNEHYFRNRWTDALIELSADEDQPLYEHLRQYSIAWIGRNKVRILVDYSSMSRVWYNAVLNWIRYAGPLPPIEVDFVYSRGEYASEYYPLVIRNILALPGCEASPKTNRTTTALFGLGFDSTVALSVLDRLEPNAIYAFLASPGTMPGYDEKTRRLNNLFMAEATKVLSIPIGSVAVALRMLREFAAPDLGRNNIVVVPLGPKPHILAAILLSRLHEGQIGCLRVSGHRSDLVDVMATGELIVTRVHF